MKTKKLDKYTEIFKTKKDGIKYFFNFHNNRTIFKDMINCTWYGKRNLMSIDCTREFESKKEACKWLLGRDKETK